MKTASSETIARIETLLSDGKLKTALKSLHDFFHSHGHSDELDETIALEGRLASLERDNSRISDEDFRVEKNRIQRDAIVLLNKIKPVQTQNTQSTPIYSEGKLLHNIPRTMKKGDDVECKIRIAHTKNLLLKGFKRTPDTTVRTIGKIGKLMAVELKPFNASEFEILTITQKPKQRIFPDIYTEWTFFIRPLQTGRHKLILDVMLIIEEDDKEREWELAFTEEVEVTTTENTSAGYWQTNAYLSTSPVMYQSMPWWQVLVFQFPILYKSILLCAGLAVGGSIGYFLPEIIFEDKLFEATAPKNHQFKEPAVYFMGQSREQDVAIRFEQDTVRKYRLYNIAVPDKEPGLPDTVYVWDNRWYFKGKVDRDSYTISLKPAILSEGDKPVWPPPIKSCRTILKTESAHNVILISIDSLFELEAVRIDAGTYFFPFCDFERSHHLEYREKINLDRIRYCSTIIEPAVIGQDTIYLNCNDFPANYDSSTKPIVKYYLVQVKISEHLNDPALQIPGIAKDSITYDPEKKLFEFRIHSNSLNNLEDIAVTGYSARGGKCHCEQSGQRETDTLNKIIKVNTICKCDDVNDDVAVTINFHRKLKSPKVVVGNQRVRDFRLINNGTSIQLKMPRSDKSAKVRVTDKVCDCAAEVRPGRKKTVTATGNCACEDVQVALQVEGDANDFRNQMQLFVNGIPYSKVLPDMGKPIEFFLSKNEDKKITLAMRVTDDYGKERFIEMCSKTIRKGTSLAALSLPCKCATCPPNVSFLKKE